MKFPIPNNGSILWIIQMPLKTYDGKTVLYHPLFGKFDTLARLVPWWADRQTLQLGGVRYSMYKNNDNASGNYTDT